MTIVIRNAVRSPRVRRFSITKRPPCQITSSTATPTRRSISGQAKDVTTDTLTFARMYSTDFRRKSRKPTLPESEKPSNGITVINSHLAAVLRRVLSKPGVSIEKMMMGYKLRIDGEYWIDNSFGSFILDEYPELLTNIQHEKIENDERTVYE